MVSVEERRAQSRRRAEETIARVNALLDEPRPQGPLWQVPEPEKRSPPVTRKTEPQTTPTDAWAAWTNGRITKAMDALIEAIGSYGGQQRHLTNLRFTEAERRITELEARLARMEISQ